MMENIVARYLENLHVAMDKNDQKMKRDIEKKLCRVFDKKK
jgi:hypothetical protein